MCRKFPPIVIAGIASNEKTAEFSVARNKPVDATIGKTFVIKENQDARVVSLQICFTNLFCLSLSSKGGDSKCTS